MMIMENIPNPFEELFEELQSIKKDTALILKQLGKVDLSGEFNIKGQKKAAKILNTSISNLQAKIKEGKILKENTHYRVSDTNKYSFNEGALLSVKGLI